MISGQNPGTNHPRMLTALEKAKQNGAKILAINPLPEAGLLRFRTRRPPAASSGVGTGLADLHLPIRINGDLALWQAIGALILEAEEAAGNDGCVLDRDFIERLHDRLRGVGARDQEPRLGPGRASRPA